MVVSEAMPKDPPSCLIILFKPVPCPISGPFKSCTANVVNGTNKSAIPAPRITKGQKKSPVPDERVEPLSIQQKIKNKNIPILAIICAGTPLFSIIPINGMHIMVTKPPGKNNLPVCKGVKPNKV